MKIAMLKTGGVLVADNQHAVDVLSKITEGRPVMADVRQSRNIGNHKRFFAFLQAVFDMQDHFLNVEQLRYWMIMKAGYVDSFSAPNGHVIFKAQSIDFSSLDEIKFKQVFNDCIDVVLAEFNLSQSNLRKVVDFS